MKVIRKILLAAVLVLPVNVFAEGMIGTHVIADAVGVTNLYYQHKLGDSSALNIGYVTLSGIDITGGTVTASSYSVSYKGYFSNYANGGFWQMGAASINVTAVSGGSSLNLGSVTLPILTAGYESTMGSLVLGAEAGLGTNQGWGVLSLYAAYKF